MDNAALIPDRGRLIVVGGGLAAARTCEEVRKRGFAGDITMLSDEPHAPYDRPPLSKNTLNRDHDPTLPFSAAALGVHLRLAESAVGLDTERRSVTTNRSEIRYDALVIATGATPIRLPGNGPQLTLRTLDDAQALRGRLTRGSRVILIGASWIGAEVATAALARGAHVTCVEAGPAPSSQVLGTEAATRLLLPLWSEADLRLNTAVEEVHERGVRLLDGTDIPADVVVTGVGARPETAWLESSGVRIDRGVLVDEHLRTSVPGVLAVGDVAVRWSPRRQQRVHAGHWDEAATGAVVAAQVLLSRGGDTLAVHDPIPYFWSDQFGHRYQYVGWHRPQDRLIWREHPSGLPTAAWLADDGRLVGALTVDRPKELAHARRAITAGATPDPDSLADPDVPLS
ncbi:NAD(P)/FAD-dependent oxidoreductase [Nocardia sp. CA-120079]|uniref:NAD(P)/FAD-dependent oxidoreductase n=1 Tax=Nocardia sp. CA-120079 TaxID=3239974 RepID=UPI003D96170F